MRVNKQSFKLCIAKTKYYIYNNKPFFENRLFDAWGNLVKLTNGTGIVLTAFFITDRGYTGHEHLLSVGIIHMNGRLYDPMLHRFLSPDNYVQDPSNTQNFNRYGYVMNNPLTRIDPDGELAFLAILWIVAKGAMIGAGIGAAGYTASVALSDGGFNNWNWGSFGKAVGIGALSGALTAGIGQGFGAAGKFGHELLRAGAHGLSGGFTNLAFGGDFMQGFASGTLGSLAGSGFQELGGKFAKSAVGTIGFSSLGGGVGAELSGGEFWKGATTGAIVAGLNHLAHTTLDGDRPKPKPKKILSEDGRKIVDGAGIAVQSTEGVAGALASGELTPEAMKSMKGILKVAGKLSGILAFTDDASVIFNKGLTNASAVDYVKAGISFGLIFAKSNPYIFIYNVADIAGYNAIDVITNIRH